MKALEKGEVKALRKAIRIWMARSYGIENDERCPLCDYHEVEEGEGPNCSKCCVAINAFMSDKINPQGEGIENFYTCNRTPYQGHADARHKAYNESTADNVIVNLKEHADAHPAVKEAARVETEYLVSLLPEANKKRWDMKKEKIEF